MCVRTHNKTRCCETNDRVSRNSSSARSVPFGALADCAPSSFLETYFFTRIYNRALRTRCPDPCLAMPACCPLFDSNSTSYIHTCILSSRPRSSAVGPTLHPPMNGLMLSWPSPKTESAAGFSTVGENGHVLEKSIARDTMMCHFGSSRASMVKRQIHYGVLQMHQKNFRADLLFFSGLLRPRSQTPREAQQVRAWSPRFGQMGDTPSGSPAPVRSALKASDAPKAKVKKAVSIDRPVVTPGGDRDISIPAYFDFKEGSEAGSRKGRNSRNSSPAARRRSSNKDPWDDSRSFHMSEHESRRSTTRRMSNRYV